jgi:hypothetical protein
MLTKKIFAFALVFVLFLPSISSNVLSWGANENTETNKNSGLIWKLLKLRFDLGFLNSFSLGRYFYRQLRPPVAIQAYPDAVDLRYLNETVFNIGGKNPVTLEWEPMIKVAGSWSFAWLNPRIIFSFEFVPPEDAPGDVWNVQFEPNEIIMDTNKENLDWPGADTPFKTNVTIFLKPSADPTYPSQDVVLKVNIVREEVLDHLRILSGSPKWVRTDLDLYKEKMNAMDPDQYQYWSHRMNIFTWNRISRRVFFLLNLRFPPYDKWVDSTVEILIRVNKYHELRIFPPPPQDIEPFEVKTIPVTVKNIGSHIDTYNFRVSSTDDNMVVTPPPAITLSPGEEAQALVGVAAPKSFLSIGSTASVFLEAYSVDDPNSVFPQTITLSTIGIHATGGSTYNFSLLMITLVIVAAIIMYIIRKRREGIVKKPEKPWDIPEEKKYLEKLKEKDNEKYNKTLDMMKDEYRSALLWHRYFCDALLRKENSSRKKIEINIGLKKLSKKLNKTLEKRRKSIKDNLKARSKARAKAKEKEMKLKEKEKKSKADKKKIEAKKEEKEEKKPAPEPKIIEKEKPKEIEIKQKIVDKKAELERKRKKRIVDRIRRAQEKQAKKVGE